MEIFKDEMLERGRDLNQTLGSWSKENKNFIFINDALLLHAFMKLLEMLSQIFLFVSTEFWKILIPSTKSRHIMRIAGDPNKIKWIKFMV